QFQLADDNLKAMKIAAPDLAGKSLRAAEAAQRQARVRLSNGRQALLNLGLDVHIADVADLPDIDQLRLVRLLGLPEALRRELDAKTLTANLLPVTAPFAGQVVERNIAVGEVVQ